MHPSKLQIIMTHYFLFQNKVLQINLTLNTGNFIILTTQNDHFPFSQNTTQTFSILTKHNINIFHSHKLNVNFSLSQNTTNPSSLHTQHKYFPIKMPTFSSSGRFWSPLQNHEGYLDHPSNALKVHQMKRMLLVWRNPWFHHHPQFDRLCRT